MSETQTEAESQRDSLNEYIDDGDAEDMEEAREASLEDGSYPEMMNVARSARENYEDVDISTDGPEKKVLRARMAEEGIFFGTDGKYYIETEDGVEEVERLESNPSSNSSGSSGPTDKTILYCLTRAETTEDRLEEIEGALEDLGYELRDSESEDAVLVVLPVEEQEGVEEEEVEEEESEEADEEETEETDESGEEEAESDSDEEEDESPSDEEESEEEQSEGSEEESEEEAEEETSEEEEASEESDDAKVGYEVYKDRLEDKNKDELYNTAVELDIDDRSNKTKAELVDAILEARVEEGKVEAPDA